MCNKPEPEKVADRIKLWSIFFSFTAICQVVTSVLMPRLNLFYKWNSREEVIEMDYEDIDYINF